MHFQHYCNVLKGGKHVIVANMSSLCPHFVVYILFTGRRPLLLRLPGAQVQLPADGEAGLQVELHVAADEVQDRVL